MEETHLASIDEGKHSCLKGRREEKLRTLTPNPPLGGSSFPEKRALLF